MNQRLDTSFLNGALDFASQEARHWVADALACHLHNTGYALEGNTETSDVAWFARQLWDADMRRPLCQWDAASEEQRHEYHHRARTVIRVLPDYQLRVAHRLIELSKVVRDIERAGRASSSPTGAPQ